MLLYYNSISFYPDRRNTGKYDVVALKLIADIIIIIIC